MYSKLQNCTASCRWFLCMRPNAALPCALSKWSFMLRTTAVHNWLSWSLNRPSSATATTLQSEIFNVHMIHYKSIQHEVSQLNTSQAFTQELLATIWVSLDILRPTRPWAFPHWIGKVEYHQTHLSSESSDSFKSQYCPQDRKPCQQQAWWGDQSQKHLIVHLLAWQDFSTGFHDLVKTAVLLVSTSAWTGLPWRAWFMHVNRQPVPLLIWKHRGMHQQFWQVPWILTRRGISTTNR